MAYQIMQFMGGTDRPQGYVLVGTDEHQGTSEPISVAEMEREAINGARLARFLDYRFLRAHGERIARDMGIAPKVKGDTVAPPPSPMPKQSGDGSTSERRETSVVEPPLYTTRQKVLVPRSSCGAVEGHSNQRSEK